MSKPTPSAICPSFFEDISDVHDFLLSFGPAAGQYVFKVPNNWVKQFLEHLDYLQLPPVQKKQLIELTKEIKYSLAPLSAILAEDSEPCSIQHWNKVINLLNQKHRFQHIVGDAHDPSPFDSWKDSRFKIGLSRRTSFQIGGTLNDYYDEIEIPLYQAPAGYFVDPFFDLFSLDYEEFLRKLLEKAKGSPCYDFHVITSIMNPTFKNYQTKINDSTINKINDLTIDKDFQETYSKFIPKDRKLYLHIVDSPPHLPDMLDVHDRFFITRYAGISFGRGYHFRDDPHDQIYCNALNKLTHETLVDRYINGVVNFNTNRSKYLKGPRPRAVNTFVVRG
jgi:hypothetical protein